MLKTSDLLSKDSWFFYVYFPEGSETDFFRVIARYSDSEPDTESGELV